MLKYLKKKIHPNLIMVILFMSVELDLITTQRYRMQSMMLLIMIQFMFTMICLHTMRM